MKREDIRIEVRADPKLLKTVREAVRGYACTCGLPPERCDEVVLAVDEACANSMRHSYRDRREGRVELSLHHDPKRGYIEVVLRDDGAPAPREAVTPKERPAADAAELEPGGLGVPLIRAVFDEVDYQPGKRRGNCVIMRLNCGDVAE